jgi:hypothetical protein
LLLLLQHFSLRTPLARNDRNPKTFQKERERERERDSQVSCSAAHYAEPPNKPFAEPEAHADSSTEPEPDPETSSEPFSHCRTFSRSFYEPEAVP